jgi:hypothetical protein
MVVVLQGIRVAGLHFGSRASSCTVEAKPREFFFETGPTPTHYTGPQAKAGSAIKEGETAWPFRMILRVREG